MRHRVALVCVTAGPGGVEHHVLDLAGALDNSVDLAILAADGGWLATRAQAAGLKVLAVPEPQGNADLRTLSAVRSALLGFGPRIVHSHLARSDWYAWLATRGMRNVVLISTEHGISDDRPDIYGGFLKRTVHGLGHRLRLRDAAATIAVSEATARALSSRYTRLRLEPPVVIRPSVDIERFRGIGGKVRSQGQPLPVAMIGRLSPEKGPEVLLRAAALCRDRGYPLNLEIAGEGPLRGQLEALRDELGLESSVVFAGHIDDVSAVLRKCAVLAVPSLAENLPLVVLEALSSGVPVVASDVGGIGEIVQDRVNGLLVPASDESALADALVILWRDDALLHDMSQAALASVEGFGPFPAAQKIVAVYERIA